MLIIAQKVKNNKIKLYRWAFDEIESYSLLKISVEEAHQLIDSDPEGWKLKKVRGIKEYVRNVSDKVNTVWLSLVAEHKKNNKDFMDVSKNYGINTLLFDSSMEGFSSVLIRNVDTHIIRITYDTDDIVYGINILPISNEKREEFFKDTHHSKYWKREHKYGLDLEDGTTYAKWSDYMNKMYIKYIGER